MIRKWNLSDPIYYTNKYRDVKKIPNNNDNRKKKEKIIFSHPNIRILYYCTVPGRTHFIIKQTLVCITV